MVGGALRATVEESIKPVKVEVVPAVPPLALAAKKKTPTPKSTLALAKGEVLAVATPSKRNYIPPTKSEGLSSVPQPYLRCLHLNQKQVTRNLDKMITIAYLQVHQGRSRLRRKS